jgi:hypothetical protein
MVGAGKGIARTSSPGYITRSSNGINSKSHMIRLTKEAIPSLSPGLNNITRHPSFCGVCLNFSPAVADACIGGREHLSWNGQAWDFTSTFADLLSAINDGCASCEVLREAIDGVYPRVAAWKDELWGEKEMMITMVEGNVLRVYLPEFYDEAKGFPDGLNNDLLHPNALFELYAQEGGISSFARYTIRYFLLLIARSRRQLTSLAHNRNQNGLP